MMKRRTQAARSPRGSARDRSRPAGRAAPRSIAEPLAARLDLVLGFLAGAVEHRARSSCAKCAAACSSSVDLPMPGSPPISTSDPGTTPPPSTRSNSSMPVVRRGRRRRCRCLRTAAARRRPRGVPRPALAAAAPAPAVGGTARSSTSEFHASHSGAAPQPLRRLRPAFLAGEDCLLFHIAVLRRDRCHGFSLIVSARWLAARPMPRNGTVVAQRSCCHRSSTSTGYQPYTVQSVPERQSNS